MTNFILVLLATFGAFALVLATVGPLLNRWISGPPSHRRTRRY